MFLQAGESFGNVFSSRIPDNLSDCVFPATSSSLAFFSESRICSLTSRIGHDRLRELIEAIGSLINARMNRKDEDAKTMFRFSPITFKGPSTPVEVAPEAARTYIEGTHDLILAQPFV